MKRELDEMHEKYADGGKVGLVASALQGVKNAISHLESGDHASAAAALRASPAAMQHPQVQAVQRMLQGGPSQARPAASQLRDLTNQETNASIMPTFAKGGSTSSTASDDATAGNSSIIAALTDGMKKNPAAAPVLQAHAIALLRANLAAAHALHDATGDTSGFGHYAEGAQQISAALGANDQGQQNAVTQQMMAQSLQGSGVSPQMLGPAAMQAAAQAVPQRPPVAMGQGQAPIPQPSQMGPQAQT